MPPSIDEPIERLIHRAAEARLRAIAPYSRFRVGAALLAADGSVITGCNIEAANYSLTLCAERVALCKALSEGVTRFAAIAIVTDSSQLTPPCGSCRQLLWEYCGNLQVILASPSDAQRCVYLLSDLFPTPFGSEFLSTE
ncbi:MAG: cytidine deaminase [Bryobacterales bacterium]|jgi:cytidine deaminase|nr:cytidine deaminase [Bryobacterales bacterium]